jgi:hypothetical protein
LYLRVSEKRVEQQDGFADLGENVGLVVFLLYWGAFCSFRMLIFLVFGVNSIYVGVASEASTSHLRDVCMQAIKWFILIIAIIGVLLFLYGANVYDPVVGWVGVSIFAASVVAFLSLYVYGELTKSDQKPQSALYFS